MLPIITKQAYFQNAYQMGVVVGNSHGAGSHAGLAS